MKKIFSGVLICALILCLCSVVYGCNFKKDNEVALLATMNSSSNVSNRMWVGTFQIVWNDVMEKITNGPVEFVGGTTETAKLLNKQEFKKSDISEDSYFTAYGVVSPQLKELIVSGIKKKFNETSDILSAIDWRYNPQKMLFYAMLKKDFKFLVPFDKLYKESFASNPAEVEYFGINADSDSALYKNVNVLFYNSNDDYAVKLLTKSNDEIILYRTNDNKKFKEYYADVTSKTQSYDGAKYFGHYDRLKVPDINLYKKTSFPDVEGRKIVNAPFMIDQTIETVEFKMNNEGVKLKSEAAIIMKATSAGPGHTPKIRYFYFNDTFVLFLIEKGQDVPYFALRVQDVETLNKTGKAKN